jgi:uncharacterized membrane protein/protein-disulfide isomerase
MKSNAMGACESEPGWISGSVDDSKMYGWSALTILLLCWIGMGLSVELTRIHLLVHTDPDYHSVCAISENVNCETVAASPYSVFWGLPVSLWGMVGYAFIGLVAVFALRNRRPWPWGVLFLLALASLIASMLLAFVSVTLIDSVCLFCLVAYAINLALLVLCSVVVKRLPFRTRDLLAKDAKELVKGLKLAIGLVLPCLVVIALLIALVPPYWRTPGWSDLPKLDSGTEDGWMHWIGARDPEITIVEFSDYECPHCREAHKAVRLLVAEHRERIRLVHRHLPLGMACHPGLSKPFHKRACAFAEAAECAGLQDAFWEMNDALFSIQGTVKAIDVDLVHLAVRLGLDRSRFKKCLDGREVADRIALSIEAAMKKKLRGTPSFLVGEHVFLGRIPREEMERLLHNPISQAK